jgi:hypothetical protein
MNARRERLKMPENGSVVLGRKERAQQFSVDVPSEVVWPKWEVGGDFKQTLIIKNTGKECIVLTYKLPVTKIFFMNFPETKRLSPGLAMSVEISFRPTKREYCEQLLEFTWNKSKSFFIKLRATLPEQVRNCVNKLVYCLCAATTPTMTTCCRA